MLKKTKRGAARALTGRFLTAVSTALLVLILMGSTCQKTETPQEEALDMAEGAIDQNERLAEDPEGEK